MTGAAQPAPIICVLVIAGAVAVFQANVMSLLVDGVRRGARWALWVGMASVLVACQHAPPLSGDEADSDERPVVAPVQVTQPTGAFSGWSPRPMPSKRWADFEPVTEGGLDGLQVKADGTLSLMHLTVSPARTDAQHVRFSWWLERELPNADLAQADISDSPVRLLLAFDGDRSTLSARNNMASELVKLLTGHELPYATLTYVWTRQYPPGTVLHNPRSDRIRYLVVEQGPARLGQWLQYERDFRADFQRAFGELPGPLSGVGLMTDTDNTKASTRVVYGPVKLLP